MAGEIFSWGGGKYFHGLKFKILSLKSLILLKETVSVILSDPPCKDGNAPIYNDTLETLI